jgi:hypothetical protein
VKSRFGLLGACKSCSGLQSELTSLDSIVVAKCAHCESLVLELESCRHDKMRTEKDNTPSVHLELGVLQ